MPPACYSPGAHFPLNWISQSHTLYIRTHTEKQRFTGSVDVSSWNTAQQAVASRLHAEQEAGKVMDEPQGRGFSLSCCKQGGWHLICPGGDGQACYCFHQNLIGFWICLGGKVNHILTLQINFTSTVELLLIVQLHTCRELKGMYFIRATYWYSHSGFLQFITVRNKVVN